MPLLPLDIQPGIYRDSTDYAARGRWFDMDKMRFVNGLPESIGGWQKYSEEPILGTARSSHAWSGNNAEKFFSAGTELKYYIYIDDSLTDVTPIRSTGTINNNPFATTNGSTTITVTDTAHGAYPDDFVTFSGATTFAGVTIDGEYQIVSVVDADTYTIEHSVIANATTTGGGNAVVATYQINTGLASQVFGTGWGAGTWGREGWGDNATVPVASDQIRLWSEANYGQDLVYNPRNGPIFYWSAASPTTPGVDIGSLTGAAQAPDAALWVLVSDKDRRVLALGVNPIGETDIDPMHVRWSTDGDPADWDPTDINTAGGRNLDIGREILCGINAPGEILIFTDVALYALRDNFSRLVYDTVLISPKVDLAGPNASATTESEVMWMGTSNFYSYNGQVNVVPCSVRDFVFNDINISQRFKFHAGHNSKFNEMWFFYCSGGSEEIDRYVIYNYLEQSWSIGSMVRTTWFDRSIESNPRAISTDGYTYYHEIGTDDNSATPAAPLNAYIESGIVEVGDGDRFYLTRRLFPDISFRNSTIGTPSMTITLTPQNEPGSSGGSPKTVTVVNTNVNAQDTHSRRLGLRMRARGVTVKLESNTVGVAWRAGRQRLDAVESGIR